MGVTLVGLAATMAMAASEAAQEIDPAGAGAEEIVVTGERVARSLKDTPSSVAVFGREDLERMAAPDRLQQVLQLVPNILMPTTRDAPSIRGQDSIGVLAGLPAFLGGARPRTVMQIDGRTVTFNEFVNSSEGLWDVERVEVFRTPQTTTQGVNSIAGAIFIRTADPTASFEGRARGIVGQSRRRQVSAALSGPLAGDDLAMRLSGDLYRSISSVDQSGPVVGVDDLNPDRYWTGRAKLLFKPHEAPGLKLLATYVHAHSEAPQGEIAQAPFRERRNRNYRIGYFKSDVDSVTALLSYSLGRDLESRTTVSWGKTHFRRFAPQGFGQTQIHGNDRAFETVLDWRPQGRLRVVGGISLQRTNLDQLINLERARLGVGSFEDRQRSSGLFGELTWLPAPRFSLTAGARYQSDSKRRNGVLRMSPDLPLDYDETTHAFLPKLSAAYDVSDGARVGVLVQRAYNPGGVTLDPAHRTQLEFKPEYLWNYEAFARADLPNGHGTVTANLFYNDMRDAQRQLLFDLNSPGGQVGLLQIVSEPRARTYGAEVEVAALLTAQLTIRAGVGFLNTKITRTIAPNDPFFGKEFGGAPNFTATLGSEWKPARDLSLSGQVRHVSSYWGDDSEDPLLRTDAYTVVDGRIRWDRNRFSIFAYMQNLFDKFRVLGWAGPSDAPDVEVQLLDPREIGFGVEARF